MATIDLPADALNTNETAFIENRLLATFPQELREKLREQIDIIQLEAGDTVLRRGIGVSSSIFPFGPTMISMMVDLGDGRSVEVASIGKEGAVGASSVVAMRPPSHAPK